MDRKDLFWERQANEKYEKVPKAKKGDGLPDKAMERPKEEIQGCDISTGTCIGCKVEGFKNLFVSVGGQYYCKHCYMVLRHGKERTELIEEFEGSDNAKTKNEDVISG